LRYKLFGANMDFFAELKDVIGEALNCIVQLRTDLATALSQPQANQEQVNSALAERDKGILAFQAYVEKEDLEDSDQRTEVSAMVNSLREAISPPIAPVVEPPVEPAPVEPTL